MKNIKKVIVTGGYGFIGSNLIKYLLKRNYFVINVDKLSYSANLYNLKDIKNKNYVFFKADIGNKLLLTKLLKKYNPSIIFNLAAETHVDRSIDSPEPFIKNNINAVFNLLETIRSYKKIKKKKIKLVHISTDEVYGDLNKNNKRANENYAYRPSSPYAATKASADHLIKSYIRTYNFPAIISNCSNNYGPNQFPEKLVPKIIFNILNNKSIPIYAKGLNSREWIYVEDHCRALEIISKKGKIGQNYNIGTNNSLSNIKITKLILKKMKQKIQIGKKVKIIFVKDRPGHDLRYAIDSKKIKKNLKWKPLTSLNKGISKTIDWYTDNLKYFKSINNKKYFDRLGVKI
ncbi:dTDP-glucose 4,6-dehydratase [Pelagibacteraceae bacterium]|jgi:dTDP-glucose 4,6-dehydratase|nr:dTDP-glucose 4,6-dehydratase [Pelagibacteraceae bacterium]|tara:strand:+ start:712 stop:1749 length:1038 start_codon:yes stop_codon:yes gene_type:complete